MNDSIQYHHLNATGVIPKLSNLQILVKNVTGTLGYFWKHFQYFILDPPPPAQC